MIFLLLTLSNISDGESLIDDMKTNVGERKEEAGTEMRKWIN